MSKRKRKKQKSRRPKSKPATVKELMEQQSYEEAAELLRTQLAAHASDDKRRLLAQCLVKMKNYAGALEQIDLLEEMRPFDLLYKGWLHFDNKDLDGAKDSFSCYTSLKPDCPDGYYWLGRVYNHWKYHNDKSKRLAIENFNKAISCEGCRTDAYTFLANCLPWDEDGCREKLAILTVALERHPDSEEIRLDISSLYITHLSRPQEGLDVLKPMLDGDKPNSRALWRAYTALKNMRRYPDAKRFASAIPDEHLEGLTKEHLLGDIDLLSGDFESANRTFSAIMSEVSPRIQILLHFGKADAFLSLGQPGLAVDEARKASLGMLAIDDENPNYDAVLWVDDEPQMFDITRSLTRVCNSLLCEETGIASDSVDNELRGAINFALYKVSYEEDDNSDALLLAAAECLTHPVLSQYLEDYYYRTGDFAEGLRHHLIYCRWKFRISSKVSDVQEYEAPVYLEQDQLPTTKKQCKALLRVFLSELSNCTNGGEVEAVFVPTYVTFVRESLCRKKMYTELARPAETLLQFNQQDSQVLWDWAYANHCANKHDAAEAAYRKLLEKHPEDSSALHNLSLIVGRNGDTAEALALSEKSASLSPDDEIVTKRYAQLKSHREEEERKRRRREDFLRTAVQRWIKLDYYKRQLLCTLSLISGWQGLEHLSKLSGIDEKYLGGHLRVLEEEGMLIYPKENTFEVNPHILPLIERENTHAVVTKLIHGDDNIAFKPIFNSKQEYIVYKVLIKLFPNHIVFPNMALQTVFQYRRMQDILGKDEFKFFIRSQVDFCITSTANYLPLIGFEVDSRFHDEDDQKERDAKKNSIFQQGGVPLLRLRGYGRPTETAIQNQIIDDIRSLGDNIRQMGNKSAVIASIKMEIDFDNFGAQEDNGDARRWITVTQAASISGANPGVITRAVDAGDLMGNGMTDRERRIDAVDLTQWILRRAERPEANETDAQVEQLVRKHVTD